MEFLDTLAALVLVAGPLAVVVAKVVDGIRNLTDKADARPSWLWNVAAFVVGLGLALGWQVNLYGAIADAIPALTDTDIGEGTWGQVLTGLTLGAMAGFWHDKMASWSSWASARRAGLS